MDMEEHTDDLTLPNCLFIFFQVSFKLLLNFLNVCVK